MKSVKCEKCGSHDLIMIDGVFACRDCRYKYSAEKTARMLPEGFDDLQLGREVSFGRYNQSDPSLGEPEAIKWDVLAFDQQKVLLISKYALEAGAFHKERKKVIWEKSSIRKWLNKEFIEKAFAGEEREKILPTYNINVASEFFSSWDVNYTEDKIFLLSIDEAFWYMDDKETRRKTVTPYAIKKGIFTSSDGYCMYWLRSNGSYTDQAAIVYNNGDVRTDGISVDSKKYGICPAMWVKRRTNKSIKKQIKNAAVKDGANV